MRARWLCDYIGANKCNTPITQAIAACLVASPAVLGALEAGRAFAYICAISEHSAHVVINDLYMP